jgi:hypothetical protein
VSAYDSRPDTLDHIVEVRQLLAAVIVDLKIRAEHHDESKLVEPELAVFNEFTPKLRDSTYGSEEYKSFLLGMGEGLKHHYAANQHHPEFWEQGREWASVEAFEGCYEVSNLGEVRSLTRTITRGDPPVEQEIQGQPRIAHINAFGYARLQLSREGEKTNVFVHVLVARAFVANPDDLPEVNHKDGDKLNCRAGNLEWVTRGQNVQHSFDTHLQPSPAQFIVHCVELDITTVGSTKMVRALQERGIDAASAGVLRAAQTGGTHKDLHFETARLEQHRASGIHAMSIMDLLEMLADWKAATLRHADGDLDRSITQNAQRFGYGPEIEGMLRNTANRLGWL